MLKQTRVEHDEFDSRLLIERWINMNTEKIRKQII